MPVFVLFLPSDAYKEVKKEKPPFADEEMPEAPTNKVEIPDDLKCSLCSNLLHDAVLIPCCGESFCDECNFGYDADDDCLVGLLLNPLKTAFHSRRTSMDDAAWRRRLRRPMIVCFESILAI